MKFRSRSERVSKFLTVPRRSTRWFPVRKVPRTDRCSTCPGRGVYRSMESSGILELIGTKVASHIYRIAANECLPVLAAKNCKPGVSDRRCRIVWLIRSQIQNSLDCFGFRSIIAICDTFSRMY